MERLVKFKDDVLENISKIIEGKEKEIELLIVAFLSGGHVLIEDIQGISNTKILKDFAKTLHLTFNKIDFTPDLLPMHISGVNFYNSTSGDFQFKEGPLFSNVVLVNEINKATPMIQSLLLEAMEEKQITIDGLTRQLPVPFMVLSTQNQLESIGNFPLPEAKLDRFFMRIKLGDSSREKGKIGIKSNNDCLNNLKSIIDYKELLEVIRNIRHINIEDNVMEYLIEIIEETRKSKDLEFGISPRASIDLYKAARSFAGINGRNYIIPDDIKSMAPHVLNHRIISKGIEGIDESTRFIEILVNKIKMPVQNN